MTDARSYTACVSCLSGTEINVFSGDDVTGALEPVQTIRLSRRGECLVRRGLPLAQSPDRQRLYAAVYGDQSGPRKDLVDAYAIDPVTGLLTHMSSTPVMAQLPHIPVDQTGRFLTGASEPSGLVVAYPIGARGHVQPRASASAVPLPGAHQILTDPTNRCAYVPSLSSDVLASLLFDEKTGRFHPEFTARDHSASRGGCRHLASERRSDTLAAWKIDPVSGRMSDRHTVPTPGNPHCFDVTPTGRFVVLSALKGCRIALFDVSEALAAPRHVMDLPTGAEPGWAEIL
ncbi:lactonase family protein [Roseobacter sp. YSTF-M11]|uniref:Lactonase family protein n=1 Tax=Roseobacter insulae TaxID=2859783 RepID=A0A9X1K1Z9_9RHOB|nr:beta-propeller fold lactonase family protein [Roseobacter insulae]MBW4709739.1 lactonase family protein [Roseobacter insulae]